jgi:ubiquinone biosynthesis protein Coq4
MLFGKRKRHGHIAYFTTLKGVIGMLRDPEHTESVFDIEDGLANIEATELAMRYVRADPGVARLMDERYLAPLPDLDALARGAEGSLGWAFARHIRDRGFDPDYYRKIDVHSDTQWVLMRMRQTHDLWHVMTGIGTDPIGELSLKAFELAQTRRPMAAVITSGGVLRYLIKDPDELDHVLNAIAHGYSLGREARPFLAQRWEEAWDRPLTHWRAQMNVRVDDGDARRPDADAVEAQAD